MTEIRKYLEDKKEEMIAFLGELIAVRSVEGEPTENCPFGENSAKALEIMLNKCEEFGFPVENVENYAGSADFDSTEPALAILSHLDVVPEGSGWTSDPYVLKRENGILTGRGTIDDKGPAVASLYAMKALKDLGIPLKKGVRLIFGTNEENGGPDIKNYSKKHPLPPMVFTPDGEYPVINGEKGMLRVYFSAEISENLTIKAGEVINAVPMACSVESDASAVLYEGKSAHASTPEKGENAITKFLSDYSGNSTAINTLKQNFQHNDFCGSAIFGDKSAETTCVLSLLKTVEKAEKLYIEGGIDVRFSFSFTKEEMQEIICGKLEQGGITIDSVVAVAPHYTDENSDFVQSLIRVYEGVTGKKGGCITIGGGTYVHDIEGGVAFGAEYEGGSGNMHGADEFITEESLLLNAEIMAEAIKAICG
ncbi:MAG: Sapep family Mn(2+)-dependent dipeptidase [Ruminococcus sp.]|nr:Sapep family Mn(2+)-dependent dipeptidase [Ruminococcus sp.]